jgi:hypothetical protein
MSKQLITPIATLSYPHLFKPQAAMEEGGPPKYGCVLVFPAGTDLGLLKAAALAVATAKYGDKAAGMIRGGKLRWPFRTDEDRGYPEGSVTISPTSKERPLVVGRYKSPVDGKAELIEDESKAYAGAQVKAQVGAYCYDRNGNRGVTFGLNGVQLWADGPRLDGRVSARDAFDAEEPAVADLADLTGEGEQEVAPPAPPKRPAGSRGSKKAKLAEDDGVGAVDDLRDLLG